MQIVEVKNNLVKVSYKPEQELLVLSGFVIVKDSAQAFIGQVVYLEANHKGNFAILKLLFNFDSNGVISNYNGSIPDIKSQMEIIQSQELLELLPVQTPIVMGELSQQKTILKLDKKLLEEKLLVCCEKEDDSELLIQNFAKQIYPDKKLIVIDLQGNLDFSQNKIAAGKNFKLPLNYETINFIYNTLDDANAQTKALIQDILLEVQNYIKTLPQQFIPFETFKEVVDSQYKELGIVELVLLKNKLLKYYEAGIFAQEQQEFDALRLSLMHELPTILDLSQVDEHIQKEMISYVYSLINSLNKEIYAIVNIDNSNSDKKLLKQIFTTKQVYSMLICSYSYKYLKELKQLSKDLILFAPIHQQDDFAGYNMFLNKLNAHEFIVYGQATHHLPLIVTLSDISSFLIEQPTEQQIESQQSSTQELLDEEIRKDVDQIFTAPKTEETYVEEELTEEDLDLIDDLNITDAHLVEEATTETKNTQQEFEEKTEPVENTFTQAPPVVDILPVRASSTPIVPIYSAEIEPKVQSDEIGQGDTVMHPKYGKGVVEKLISYGTKTLCSINFDNVGRRLLDPTLAEIKKVEE